MSDSPYTPPKTALYDQDDQPTAPKDRRQVDLGEALSYPFQTEGWWQTCLLVGLGSLVPLLGIFHMFGWMARIFDNVQAGQTQLPGLSSDHLLEDVKRGAIVFGVFFLNILPILIPTYGIMFSGLLFIETNEDLALVLFGVGYLLAMLMGLGMNLIFPELMRRAYLGEWNILFNPGPTIRAVRTAPGTFLLTLLFVFLGNTIGGLGVFLCYIGIFLTMPFGYVVTTHVIAQWDLVRRNLEADPA